MAFWKRITGSALVRTTLPKRADAERLARRLVESRLAACVHVSEVASIYRWDGAVRQETEFVVEARTTLGRRTTVAQAMLDGHPYDTPMVESLSAAWVTPRYLAWMAGEVR